jgi:hypothetical protein
MACPGHYRISIIQLVRAHFPNKLIQNRIVYGAPDRQVVRIGNLYHIKSLFVATSRAVVARFDVVVYLRANEICYQFPDTKG